MILRKHIKALRMSETFLMTGFILIGAVFALSQNLAILWGKLFLVSIVSYLLMLSVYTANSLLGYKDDKKNDRLKALNFVKKPFYIITTIIFYGVSFSICLWLNPESLILHFAIFTLWFLYGMPGFGKHLPIVGTIIHFLVVIVQFNFAYLFIAPISESSIAISVFFAFLISAGHIHHEIIDYEADKLNQIKTSTVKWGIKHTKYFSFSIFIIAHLYWIALYLFEITNLFQLISFCIGFVFHFGLFIYFRNKMENDYSVRLRYRLIYRIVYFLCGLAVSMQIIFHLLYIYVG